jgi:NADH-quinone oxidoreductase subunit M
VTDHLLSIVTFLPLVGAVVLVAWRKASDDASRAAALFTAVATFIISLAILGRFDRADPGFQMVERATWVKSVGLQYLVGIDGVSLWMVLLTTFLMPLAVLASWPITKNSSDDR